MTSTHLDEISTIIRRVEAAAYERGRADAKREMLQHLTSISGESKAPVEAEAKVDVTAAESAHGDNVKPAHERQRAPKGIVPKFVSRVLEQSHGLTPKQILDHAVTDFEKMIKPASVRSELRDGAKTGKYKSDNGLWSMADKGFDEAEDNALAGTPSASISSNERKQDAPSVASNVWE